MASNMGWSLHAADRQRLSPFSGSIAGGAASPERSRLTLNLVDYADRAEPSTQTLSRIREQLKGIPGVELEITKDQNGPPTGAPVNIEISGPEFDRIVAYELGPKPLLREPGQDEEEPALANWDRIDDEPPF